MKVVVIIQVPAVLTVEPRTYANVKQQACQLPNPPPLVPWLPFLKRCPISCPRIVNVMYSRAEVLPTDIAWATCYWYVSLSVWV